MFTDYEWENPRNEWENPRNNPWDDPHIMETTGGLLPLSSVPFFEYTSTSIAVRPGQTVQIPCRVRSLGDRVVSELKALHSKLVRVTKF